MPESSVQRRAARREAVRREIGKVAVELFLRRGFQQTTVDDIAEAANVSRRTFFRYFEAKEDALFAWVDEVGSEVAGVLAGRPQGEPTSVALRRALDGLVAYAEQDVERIHKLKALAGPSGLFPALGEMKQGSWSSELAEVLAARIGATDAFGATLQVNTAFSAFDWAMTRWLADPATAGLGDLVDEAFSTLRAGFS